MANNGNWYVCTSSMYDLCPLLHNNKGDFNICLQDVCVQKRAASGRRVLVDSESASMKHHVERPQFRGDGRGLHGYIPMKNK